LSDVAAWAAQNDYDCLEVAAWPSTGGRAFEASHLPVATFGTREAEQTLELLSRHGLEISALAYYENNLHPDAERREEIANHLRASIDAASALAVPYVGTFIGRDPSLSVPDNMRMAERTFPPLVDYAADRGVTIIIENCVMEGWHPDGYPGNIAYSPELWEWMVGLGLRLNWDPSHLAWIGVDAIDTIADFAPYIVHAQAKDIEIDARARSRFGCFGTVDKQGDPWRTGWWRYRVPGRGDIDWGRIVDRLYEVGFSGTLSVEHEDPLWGGTVERTLQGLAIARSTLRPLVLPHASGGFET
jgi:sugar phosphate isomerase/epimerase